MFWFVKRVGGCRRIASNGLMLGGVLSVAGITPVAASDRPDERAVARYEASMLTGRAGLSAHGLAAIPAFARKYGLACSACHTAWPELNTSGKCSRTGATSSATIVTLPSGSTPPTSPSASAPPRSGGWSARPTSRWTPCRAIGASGVAERTDYPVGLRHLRSRLLMWEPSTRTSPSASSRRSRTERGSASRRPSSGSTTCSGRPGPT